MTHFTSACTNSTRSTISFPNIGSTSILCRVHVANLPISSLSLYLVFTFDLWTSPLSSKGHTGYLSQNLMYEHWGRSAVQCRMFWGAGRPWLSSPVLTTLQPAIFFSLHCPMCNETCKRTANLLETAMHRAKKYKEAQYNVQCCTVCMYNVHTYIQCNIVNFRLQYSACNVKSVLEY